MAGKLGDSEQQRVIDRIIALLCELREMREQISLIESGSLKNWVDRLIGSQITGAKVPKNASLSLEKDGLNSCPKKAKASSSNRATSEGVAIEKSSKKLCNVVASVFAKKQCVSIVNVRA